MTYDYLTQVAEILKQRQSEFEKALRGKRLIILLKNKRKYALHTEENEIRELVKKLSEGYDNTEVFLCNEDTNEEELRINAKSNGTDVKELILE